MCCHTAGGGHKNISGFVSYMELNDEKCHWLRCRSRELVNNRSIPEEWAQGAWTGSVPPLVKELLQSAKGQGSSTKILDQAVASPSDLVFKICVPSLLLKNKICQACEPALRKERYLVLHLRAEKYCGVTLRLQFRPCAASYFHATKGRFGRSFRCASSCSRGQHPGYWIKQF